MADAKNLSEKYFHILFFVYYEYYKETQPPSTVQNNIYIFWFFYKKIAFAGVLSSTDSVNSFYDCIYCYPLFLKVDEFQAQFATKSFSMLWLFDRFSAIFHFSEVQNTALQSSSQYIESSGKKYLCYLFSIFYYSKSEDGYRFLYFFYFIHKRISLIQIWNQKGHHGFYVLPWIYFEEKAKSTNLYMFYFFYKKIAFYQKWNEEQSKNVGFYILPWIYYEQNSNVLYMLYLFHKQISLIQSWEDKSTKTKGFYAFPWIYYQQVNDSSSLYMFYLIYQHWSLIQRWKNSKSDDCSTNGFYFYPFIHLDSNSKSYSYYLLYFLNKHVALIQRWKNNEPNTVSNEGFYAFSLVYFDKDAKSSYFYMFYFILKYISLVQVWNTLDNDYQSNGFYIYPWAYSYNNVAIDKNLLNENGFSILYLTKYISVFNHRVSEKDNCTYMLILFYHEVQKEVVNVYGLWFISKYVSLFQHWSNPTSHSNGTFLLLLFYYSKEGQTQNGTDSTSFSLFWVYKTYISLFYHCKRQDDTTTWLVFVLLVQNMKDYYSFNLLSVPYYFDGDTNKGTFYYIQTASFLKYFTNSLDRHNIEFFFYIFPWILLSNTRDADSKDQHQSISLLWIIHSRVSMFYYSQTIEKDEKSNLSYLLLIYHFERSEKNSNLISYHLNIMWFFYKKIALFQRWINLKTSMYDEKSGVTVFLLLRYEFQKDLHSNTDTTFSLFWFWSSLFAIFYYSHQKKITSGDSYKSFWLLVYYLNTNKAKSELFLFWIVIKRIALCEIWSIRVDSSSTRSGMYIFLLARYEYNSTKTSQKDEKESHLSLLWLIHKYVSIFYLGNQTTQLESSSLSYLFLMYFYKKVKNANEDENEFYLFYFIYYKIALLSITYLAYAQLGSSFKGISVFYLFKLENEKDNTKDRTFLCVFWIFHRYVSLFYLERTKTQKRQVEENRDVMFLLFIFFVEREGDKLFKLAIFWFFVRQASFIRFSYLPEDVKILFFPFFKYQRVRGKFARWCLFPLVPIKYSFVANIMVYEKEVFKLGPISNGIEDKTKRRNNKRVRVLYKVFRWSEDENGVVDVEFNPIYYSHADGIERKGQWLCCGGLCGVEELANNAKTKVKKDFRYCCCLYCNLGTEDFVDKGKYSNTQSDDVQITLL
jgi:hypothetical protein